MHKLSELPHEKKHDHLANRVLNYRAMSDPSFEKTVWWIVISVEFGTKVFSIDQNVTHWEWKKMAQDIFVFDLCKGYKGQGC